MYHSFKRVHLFHHDILPHLGLRIDFIFPICKRNYPLNDWKNINYNHICSESTGFTWISSSSSNYNRILDITHNWFLILISISVLIGYIITTLCHHRCDLEWYWFIWRWWSSSIATYCNILLVFLLSTCWEFIDFTIEVSSNVTSLLKMILSFGS